jgi:hypothetical protein
LSIGEMMIYVIFFMISVVWAGLGILNSYNVTKLAIGLIGRMFGHLSLINFMFSLFPIAKNSIWILIFGIPFERAILFHKNIAKWTYIW